MLDYSYSQMIVVWAYMEIGTDGKFIFKTHAKNHIRMKCSISGPLQSKVLHSFIQSLVWQQSQWGVKQGFFLFFLNFMG